MSDRTTFICPHCHEPALIIDEDAFDSNDVGGGGIDQTEDGDPSDDELATITTAKKRSNRKSIGFKR